MPSREDWYNYNVNLPDDIVCFTDGSRHLHLRWSGASVSNQMLSLETTVLSGRHSTVFFRLRYV